MSEERIKNVATTIAFPLIDASTYEPYTTSAWGELTSASIISYSWSDTTSLSAHNITSIPVQAGNGIWQLPLTQEEMNPSSGNHDYIIIKLDAYEIESQNILIKLLPANLDADIVSIKAKTDLIPNDPASNSVVYTRLATSAYTSASGVVSNEDILAIKAKTDLLTFSGSNINARIVDASELNDISVADILSGTVDTKTVSQILEILLALASGRISVNGNIFTYYKQDNSTELYTLTGSDTARTRS